MVTLIIDTSHRTAQIGLVQDGKIIAQKQWSNGPLTGREVLRAIDDVLRENKLVLSDVRRVAVHAGPGGYSSLRAGIVTTLMLRSALGGEIVAVTGEALEEMAQQAIGVQPTEHITAHYRS